MIGVTVLFTVLSVAIAVLARNTAFYKNNFINRCTSKDADFVFSKRGYADFPFFIKIPDNDINPIFTSIDFNLEKGVFDETGNFTNYNEKILSAYDNKNPTFKCTQTFKFATLADGDQPVYKVLSEKNGVIEELLSSTVTITFLNNINKYLYERLENKKLFEPVGRIKSCEFNSTVAGNKDLTDKDIFYIYEIHKRGGGAGYKTFLHKPYQEFPFAGFIGNGAYSSCEILFLDMFGNVYFRCAGGDDPTISTEVKSVNLDSGNISVVQTCDHNDYGTVCDQ